MLGSLSLAAYLLISSTTATTPNAFPACLRDCTSDTIINCGPRCLDTIAMNRKVVCDEIANTGALSCEYRNKLKKLGQRRPLIIIAQHGKTIDFGSSGVSISLEGYKMAVNQAICTLLGRNEYKNSESVNRVLCHIFKAVKGYSRANERDLLVFTAIAMHNHNYLTYVPTKTSEDRSFDHICRGLMQIKSKKYYEKLNLGSSIDYINEPWRLNQCDERTVYDEFKLYFEEFRPVYAGDNSSSMWYSVVSMASIEGQALAFGLTSGFDISTVTNQDVRAKLLRRHRILCALAATMQVYSQAAASVRL